MILNRIFAQLNCTDIKTSADWYRNLFGRSHDADPMDGLKEWHHGKGAGFQLVANPDMAGRGSMTLIMSGLADEHERLVSVGLDIGELVVGDFALFAQISDPDGNSIVLAEPKAS